MAPALKTIKLNKIYLDLSNPRHEPVKSEAEAMQQLLLHEDIRSLAKHIAQVGTSPLDLMALIPHPKVVGGYTTAEGNRRLCALKVLLDPDKAHTEADKRYFHALKKALKKPINEVSAMVFSDMSAARPWVELRHKGEQDGRGTKLGAPTKRLDLIFRPTQTIRTHAPCFWLTMLKNMVCFQTVKSKNLTSQR